MSYATPADVETLYPSFVPDQSGSVSDSDIQGWLDDGTAQVHAAFYMRGLDTDSLATPVVGNPSVIVPIGDQPDVLRDMVRTYGVYKLGLAIFAALSPVEQTIARSHYNLWVSLLKGIAGGTYDLLFAPGYARTIDISPGFVGTAGAETPTATVYDSHYDGQNIAFRKNLGF